MNNELADQLDMLAAHAFGTTAERLTDAAARIRELSAEVERLGTELNEADELNGEVIAQRDRLLAAIPRSPGISESLWLGNLNLTAAEVRAEMEET